jgi:sec-independent protein translocase protein TatB
VETAARDFVGSIRAGSRVFEMTWQDATSTATAVNNEPLAEPPSFPEYKHPRKKWRIKQGATPTWYKARNGIRTKALSGAARVARYRPKKYN